MQKAKQDVDVLRLIVLLTLLFVAGQVTFLSLGELFGDVTAMTRKLFTPELLLSPAILPDLVRFLLSQFSLYCVYVFTLWYVATTIYESVQLSSFTTQLLCVFIWLMSVVTILALNIKFVPHSVFTRLILHDLFNDSLTSAYLGQLFWIIVAVNCLLGTIAIIGMVKDLISFKNIPRHVMMLGLLIGLIPVFLVPQLHFYKKTTVATAERPNIIIIGFDAVRPDFIRFFNPNALPTPHFNEFLKKSIIFSRTYTPLARTLPSWVDLLTAQYPLHHHIRENNTLLDLVKINDTLPKRLKDQGYLTLYASDDRRFNNIDQRFGFDQVIGPQGNVSDFIFGSLNDFPLSNLIATTLLGKVFFPFNYANHGADFVYKPENFLREIELAIRRAPGKPMFLAVHFNLSAYPFQWFDDHMAYDTAALNRYKNAIVGDDKLLAKFMTLLRRNHYLDHAIVVLLSDHGITHGLHNDRITNEDLYEGDASKKKIKRSRYAEANDYELKKEDIELLSKGETIALDNNTAKAFDMKDMGLDTSYGYGGDLLSLKQNYSLLAIRGFGVAIGQPHVVAERSLLLDISPTLLDFLNDKPLANADGVSLLPYMLDANLTNKLDRPLFFESAYSIDEIEQKDIILAKVLEKSLNLFYVNKTTGAVTLYPPLLKVLVANKQRAILYQDWLLVYYPQSERYSFVIQTNSVQKSINDIVIYSKNAKGEKIKYLIQKHLSDPYFVLVNVKTGKWTTSINSALAKSAPIDELIERIDQFYGDEMDAYTDKVFKA